MGYGSASVSRSASGRSQALSIVRIGPQRTSSPLQVEPLVGVMVLTFLGVVGGDFLAALSDKVPAFSSPLQVIA